MTDVDDTEAEIEALSELINAGLKLVTEHKKTMIFEAAVARCRQKRATSMSQMHKITIPGKTE